MRSSRFAVCSTDAIPTAAPSRMQSAEVESTADSYDPGIVDAVLHVEKVNGSAASFRRCV